MNVIEEVRKGRKFQTRDGKPVRIVATDVRNLNFPVLGLVMGYECEHSISFTEKGTYHNTGVKSRYDLVLVPKKITKWTNVYKNEKGFFVENVKLFSSKKEAEKNIVKSRQFIATVPITINL